MLRGSVCSCMNYELTHVWQSLQAQPAMDVTAWQPYANVVFA